MRMAWRIYMAVNGVARAAAARAFLGGKALPATHYSLHIFAVFIENGIVPHTATCNKPTGIPDATRSVYYRWL